MSIEDKISELTAELKRGNDIAAERNRLQAALLESMKQGPNDETRAMFGGLRDAIYNLTAIERVAPVVEKPKRARKTKAAAGVSVNDMPTHPALAPELTPENEKLVDHPAADSSVSEKDAKVETQDTQSETIAEADLPDVGADMPTQQDEIPGVQKATVKVSEDEITDVQEVPVQMPVPQDTQSQPAANERSIEYQRDIVPLCVKLMGAGFGNEIGAAAREHFGVQTFRHVTQDQWPKAYEVLRDLVVKHLGEKEAA